MGVADLVYYSPEEVNHDQGGDAEHPLAYCLVPLRPYHHPPRCADEAEKSEGNHVLPAESHELVNPDAAERSPYPQGHEDP